MKQYKKLVFGLLLIALVAYGCVSYVQPVVGEKSDAQLLEELSVMRQAELLAYDVLLKNPSPQEKAKLTHFLDQLDALNYDYIHLISMDLKIPANITFERMYRSSLEIVRKYA